MVTSLNYAEKAAGTNVEACLFRGILNIELSAVGHCICQNTNMQKNTESWQLVPKARTLVFRARSLGVIAGICQEGTGNEISTGRKNAWKF